MSLSSTNNRNDYVGNGNVDTYAYSFRIFDETDLLVTVRNTSDVETTLVLTTDYTVTGVGDAGGGNVVLVNSGQAWLDGGGDLLTNYALTIRRVRPLTQTTDIRNQGSFFPETHEDSFDHAIMIAQQLDETLDRSTTLPETIAASEFDNTLPTDIVGSLNTVLMTNATGDGWEMGATASEISNAQTYATNASASATAAASSASAAATSASAASASATAAQAAVDSVMFQDVVFKTFADSPITITNSDTGKLFSVDATGGAVVFNLPAISGLTLTNPWSIGIKKSDSSGNSITINRNGTDVIDGNTSKTIGVSGAGVVLIPDTDPSPDYWTTQEFGASAGNLTVDNFNGDGTTTGFTLSVSPASENNTWVSIDGILQHKNTYSVSGTTLTFSSAPPTGTNNIEVISGTTLSIGTPSDGTVTRAKCATGGFGSLNVVSKTANYTVTSSDDLILCDSSGGAFTLTLPTAVGIGGRVYKFRKTDSTFATANAITISAGASTIDGSSSTTLNTQYETLEIISDGSNWHVVRRHIPSNFISYTPDWYNFATQPTIGNGSISGTWRRVGDSMQGFYRINWGSTTTNGTGGLFTFGTPSGITIDSSKLPISIGNTCGTGAFYDSSANQSYVYATSISTSTRFYLYMTAVAAANLITDSTPVTPANGDSLAFNFFVPITGWNA